MNERYKKAKATRLKNNPNAYSEMGSAGGKKGTKWLTGNSEYMTELVNKRWDKYRELKAEQQDEAKEALENFNSERGE